MKIATAAQISNIDYEAINKYGIPEMVLMENAGGEVAKQAISTYGEQKKFCIVAGYGNNGGDAFVAARHLISSGAKCKIFLLGNKTKADFKTSTLVNYNVLEAMGVEIHHLVSERDWNRFEFAITFSDAIIDGLIGTGLHGEISEIAYKAIEKINQAKTPVLSIDIPSGLNADSGKLSPIAIKANQTVTFGIPKMGMFMVETKSYVGELIVKNISLPKELLNSDKLQVNAVDKTFAQGSLQPRPHNVHKGQCGKVLVIAGSTPYTGAAILAAQSVLRMGAGLVTLAVPSSIYPVVASKALELIVEPMKDNNLGHFVKADLAALISLAEKADVVLIGPGMGRDPETLGLISELVNKIDKPLILDADAIYALKHCKELIIERENPTIITPHLGELAYFADYSVEEIREDCFTIGENLAKELKATLVMKSEQTITFTPAGEIYINTSGNAGMATAGAGDVLAGAIAGLVAENNVSHPVPLAVYLHGIAGDLAAQLGLAGLLAGDISRNLQQARQTIQG